MACFIDIGLVLLYFYYSPDSQIYSFDVSTAVIFLVDVFWVVMLCGVVVGGGSMDLQNVGILP